MNKPKVQYAVWIDAPDNEFWHFYDTFQDAVDDNNGAEIFIFKGRSLGRFVKKTKNVPMKKPRRRKSK